MEVALVGFYPALVLPLSEGGKHSNPPVAAPRPRHIGTWQAPQRRYQRHCVRGFRWCVTVCARPDEGKGTASKNRACGGPWFSRVRPETLPLPERSLHYTARGRTAPPARADKKEALTALSGCSLGTRVVFSAWRHRPGKGGGDITYI